MKQAAFIHEATRQYAYPIERNCIELKLICLQAKDVSCRLVYWNRLKKDGQQIKKVDAYCYARDKHFSYFRCRIAEDEAVKYIRYYFEIYYDDTTSYLSAHGMSHGKPQDGFFEYLYTNENDVFKIPEWMNNAIVYQIFPERFYNGDKNNDPHCVEPWGARPTRENFFGGDIRGIISKLDYIQSLCIDAIYLNPIFQSPSNHKYDTADYYQIDPAFGSMEDFKELVQKCHDRGIRVILDGVFNHCGYYFKPFQDVLINKENSKYKDWFFVRSYPVETDPPNYECVGYYKWMPKLRLSNPNVRNYFLDVGAYWLEQADIDGWRLDVSDEVDFTFWQEFRRRIKAVNKDAVLLGETWKDGQDLLRGDQMDSVMNYLFRDAVVAFMARGSINAHEFDSRIQKMRFLYADAVLNGLYNLIGSHDTDRFLTLCSKNVERLKLAAGFQFTFPGMPVIYYGDEIGMHGGNDPDCRGTMCWDDIDQSLLSFYKKLIAIRKANRCLSKGSFETIVCDSGLYGFARRVDGEAVYVVINASEKEHLCIVPVFENNAECEYECLLNTRTYTSKPLESDSRYYNSDIFAYTGYIELSISGYSLEILKIKEKS